MTGETMRDDDVEIRRMQELLRGYRWSGEVPPAPPRALAPPVRAAAAAALLAAALGLAAANRGTAPPDPGTLAPRETWSAFVDGAPLRDGPHGLGPGSTLTTGADAVTTLRIPSVGRVEIGPASRVRILRAEEGDRRLALDRGSLRAVTSAVPRTFFVETPAGTAVDLGCVFDVLVDDDGTATLRVDVGWVEFERDGLHCLVPAGAVCRTRPGAGPGLPRFTDAAPALAAALDAVEEGRADATVVDAVVGSATVRDTLSLWHLLPRLHGSDRERVAETARALVPLPPGTTVEGVLRLDVPMLEAWKESMRRWW